ncbi:hypothetical protein T492DRAFT_386753 [Pavlovales sp. CCMP2436]|nr:hypothetical protein T492DRAFT_386753 [Pavlovales sp. CCMP2436]
MSPTSASARVAEAEAIRKLLQTLEQTDSNSEDDRYGGGLGGGLDGSGPSGGDGGLGGGEGGGGLGGGEGEGGLGGGVRVPVLLLGDLNTLSPLDAIEHRRVGLREKMGWDPPLANKFLAADGTLAYQPMNVLLDGGLVDLGHLANPGEHSVPTLVRTLNQ